MFDEEFEGLNLEIKLALTQRLEEVIRLIYQRNNHANKDHSIRNYTKEELSAMISAPFDLAQRLKSE